MKTFVLLLVFVAIFAGISHAKPAEKLNNELLQGLEDLFAESATPDTSNNNALQQEENSDDDYDDEEVAAQFWGFLARHAGRLLCRHIRSDQEVLEQNINKWLDEDAKIMQEDDDDVAQLERWRFGRRIKGFFRRHRGLLRRIGRGVCRAVYHQVAEQNFNEEDDETPIKIQQDFDDEEFPPEIEALIQEELNKEDLTAESQGRPRRIHPWHMKQLLRRILYRLIRYIKLWLRTHGHGHGHGHGHPPIRGRPGRPARPRESNVIAELQDLMYGEEEPDTKG